MNLFEAYRSNPNRMVFDGTVHDPTKPQVLQIDDQWVFNDAPHLPVIIIVSSTEVDVQDIVSWVPFNNGIIRDHVLVATYRRTVEVTGSLFRGGQQQEEEYDQPWQQNCAAW